MQMLSTLRRSPLMPLLVAIQVALACAILANVLFLLAQQAAPLLVSDGIVRGQVLLVDQLIQDRSRWTQAQVQAGAQAIRALPGVRAVSPTMGLPARAAMTFVVPLKSAAGITAEPSGFAGDGLVDTLGLQLVQGRDFDDGDYAGNAGVFGKSAGSHQIPVILTAALARHLFPDGHALGSQLQGNDGPDDVGRYLVVGVVAHLLRHQMDELDDGRSEFSLLYPQRRFDNLPILAYAVRTDPQRRDTLRVEIADTLRRQFGSVQAEGVPITVEAYEEVRAESLGSRRAAVWLLGTVCMVVVLITLLGIASVSAYWVEQRIRQIGIRRALGATRAQVQRQFQLENLLVVVVGLLAGLPLALGVNQLLMQAYELARLPLSWLPLGALILMVLGQLAVFGPARRAAAIAPATATRAA